MEIIRKLNREQGVTVILVTHEADIGAYADRLIVMRDGKIESDEHQTAVTACRRGGNPRHGCQAAGRIRRPTQRRLALQRGLPVDGVHSLSASAGRATRCARR